MSLRAARATQRNLICKNNLPFFREDTGDVHVFPDNFLFPVLKQGLICVAEAGLKLRYTEDYLQLSKDQLAHFQIESLRVILSEVIVVDTYAKLFIINQYNKVGEMAQQLGVLAVLTKDWNLVLIT